MPPTTRSVITRVMLAVRHPGRAMVWAWRKVKLVWLRLRTRHDEMARYRALAARSRGSQSSQLAVGTAAYAQWLSDGEALMTFLTAQGLSPHHRVLELGCGGLRVGWRIIVHLEDGQYTGVEVSNELLTAAQHTVTDRHLAPKQPRLLVSDTLDLSDLPTAAFDIVHSTEVAHHLSPGLLGTVIGSIGRVMKPGGFADLTFTPSASKSRHTLEGAWSHSVKTLSSLADHHGLAAEVKTDGPTFHLLLRHSP